MTHKELKKENLRLRRRLAVRDEKIRNILAGVALAAGGKAFVPEVELAESDRFVVTIDPDEFGIWVEMAPHTPRRLTHSRAVTRYFQEHEGKYISYPELSQLLFKGTTQHDIHATRQVMHRYRHGVFAPDALPLEEYRKPGCEVLFRYVRPTDPHTLPHTNGAAL